MISALLRVIVSTLTSGRGDGNWPHASKEFWASQHWRTEVSPMAAIGSDMTYRLLLHCFAFCVWSMSLETSIQNFGVISGCLLRSFMSCRIKLRRVSSSRVHFPVWHLINRNQGFILDLPWHLVPLFSKFWCLWWHSSVGRSINSPICCQSNCLPTKLGNCIITQLSEDFLSW